MPAESKCEIIRPLLSDYVDGETGGADAARVESHLPACPSCASHLAFLRAVNFALSEPAENLPPARMHARIAALTYARPTLSSRISGWARSLTPPGRVAVGLGGAVAVALVAAVTLTRPLGVSPNVAEDNNPAVPGASGSPSLASGSRNGGSATVAVAPKGGAASEGGTVSVGTTNPSGNDVSSSASQVAAAGAAASKTGAGSATAASGSAAIKPPAPPSGVPSSVSSGGTAGRMAVAVVETTTVRPSPASPPRGGVNGTARQQPSPLTISPAAGMRSPKAVAALTPGGKTTSGKSGPKRNGGGSSGTGAPISTDREPIIPPSTVPGISGGGGGSIASVSLPEPKIIEPEPTTPAPTVVASVVSDTVRGDVSDNGRIRLKSTQKVAGVESLKLNGNAHAKRGGAFNVDAHYSPTDMPGATGSVVSAPVK